MRGVAFTFESDVEILGAGELRAGRADPRREKAAGVQNHGRFGGSAVRGGGVRPAVSVEISRDDGDGRRANRYFGNERCEHAFALVEKNRHRVVGGVRDREIGEAVQIVVRHGERRGSGSRSVVRLEGERAVSSVHLARICVSEIDRNAVARYRRGGRAAIGYREIGDAILR